MQQLHWHTKLVALGRQLEDSLNVVALLALGLLPALEWLLRACCHSGLRGSAGYVQHLTLWVGLLGAMLATRQKRHLNLATGVTVLLPRFQALINVLVLTISTVVTSGLCWASVQFVRTEMAAPAHIAGWLPIWMVEVILPVAFAALTVRFVLQAGGWQHRLVAGLGVLTAMGIGFLLTPYASHLLWPGLAVLIGAALLGAPIFVVLGGSALLLFFADGVPVAAIPVETYRIVVSPTLPTIPLFTLTGYILAEGGASRRLVRLFHALFGWIPGGLALVATLVCAFFTTFTGASGVTILALGGLLLPILRQHGYRERFAVGFLTATGSLGLLFPPSLAVILYGVMAHVSIPDLFKAGIVPGGLMIAAISLLAMREARRAHTVRPAFDAREALHALWQAKWEIALPMVALGGIFGGWCTLVEAAAITVVYTLLVETVIHGDLHIGRDLPRVFIQCSTLLGGIFIILGVAMGLTNYLVDAEVPMQAAAWVQAHIQSRLLFLLVLNVFLLLVGCLMDIFSAIVVVVPLILPIGQVFGIHPLHLGMIFLANLELGYLTPPVGMNLFLASYRFDTPLMQVYQYAMPFLLILLLVVLLITYVPALIIGVG